ncbi:Membrane alanyl aminopeptidase [[Leptolyngbya] sp. PCC 7376]|uniref:M1 family metallopeptidase n=1 Tax=[Leptolyngbya] sp. PCC 7376 TaxID=111781 RepID=UPI00029EF080|nr:M1 family metallopeptidase [[Leptolyngbya] sp. PCC 7376]AFY40649.1 Membrane alanyl aminopeptidase [[Leptolyngbya] sp. PCC 7376]
MSGINFEYFVDTEDARSFELPGAKPHYNPDRPGQVEHILLDLDLDIAGRSLAGTCTITLAPIRSGVTTFKLDAVDMVIESVCVGNVSQPFDYDGEFLTVTLLQPTTTEKIDLAIAYKLEEPQRGIYFIQPDEHYPDKPVQVWTQGEDEDSRFWFPCFDYPGQLATSEIKIRVPKPYRAISNGELVGTEEQGDRTQYHWHQKEIHPSYLVTLAVGDFAEIQDEWQGIPVLYYVEKGKESEGDRSMGKTPEMMDFLSETYGYKYPFPKYAQVCVDDFIFGGMENTSTTLLTDRCLLDERASLDNTRTETLVLHELAHQWFGDLVVIKHWSHAWIKEGMATYAEVLWMDHEYGKDEAAYYLLEQMRNYLAEDRSRYRRPIVTHVYRAPIELYDRHLYEKGACVYHMIRTLLGDELFFKAIQTFVNRHAHQTVETIDLLRAVETATGFNLASLFDQYVFRGGHPDFEVSYSWDGGSGLAKLSIKQTQAKKDEKALFDLNIPVAFGYVDGENVTQKTFTFRLNEAEQTFYLPLEKKPNFVSFDVGNNWTKTVKLSYPMNELKAQLTDDPDPISRIHAAEAIAKQGNLEAVKALQTALTKEPFWGVRVEIAKALGKIQLNQAEAALMIGLKDSHPRVRRATLSSLGNFKTTDSYKAVKASLLKGDDSYYTEAAAARVLGSMVAVGLEDKAPESRDLLQQILETRAGWNEVVRAGAIGGLAAMKTSPEAVDLLLPYTEIGMPQPLRLAAIRSLGAVASGQSNDKLEVILNRLEAIARETFFLTQVAIVASLGRIENPKAMSLLQTLAGQAPDKRVRQRAEETVNRLQKKLSKDKAVKSLRDDLDKLKEENKQLQSRLAKLEAQK